MHRKLPLRLTLTVVTRNVFLIAAVYLSLHVLPLRWSIVNSIWRCHIWSTFSGAGKCYTYIYRYTNVSTYQSTTCHNPENYSLATPHCYYHTLWIAVKTANVKVHSLWRTTC